MLSKTSIFNERLFVNLGVFSLLWLSLLYFGAPTASTSLDASWTQALGYVFKNNYQAGIDYVFTFGPLGYFHHGLSSYDADLFNTFMAWQIIAALLLSVFFVAIAAKIDGKIDKILYFFLLIVVISSFKPDTTYFLGITAAIILAITTLPNLNQLSKTSTLLIILLFLAVVSQTKFTNFVLVGVGIFAITVMVWHIYSLGSAIFIPLTFAIFLMAAWLLSGQSPSSFPHFFVNSLQITSGYSEAMSLGFTPTEIKLAMASFVVMTLMIVVGCLPKPWKFDRFVIAGVIMLVLFFTWKAGFVRQGLHERIFFAFAIIAPFFLNYNRNMNVVLRFCYRGLRYLAIVIALTGFFQVVGTPLNYQPNNFLAHWNHRIYNNISRLFKLPELKSNQDKTVATLKQQHDLPQIRAIVGQSTVDIFSWEQGVLFLNGLNWQPRPVFQSYAAFTPSLIAINGDFYASNKAPEFVLFKLQAIDGQFPLMNDAEALKIVLRDYEPVLTEKGYLLLKRHPRGLGLVSNGKTLLTQEIKAGELLDLRSLSQKQLLLSLEIHKSLLGRLYSLLYRFPVISMEIGTTDGMTLSYRIIPKMMTTGFVINPLILNQNDLNGWYKGEPLKQVATIRVIIKPDWLQSFFQNHIGVTVSEFEVQR